MTNIQTFVDSTAGGMLKAADDDTPPESKPQQIGTRHTPRYHPDSMAGLEIFGDGTRGRTAGNMEGSFRMYVQGRRNQADLIFGPPTPAWGELFGGTPHSISLFSGGFAWRAFNAGSAAQGRFRIRGSEAELLGSVISSPYFVVTIYDFTISLPGSPSVAAALPDIFAGSLGPGATLATRVFPPAMFVRYTWPHRRQGQAGAYVEIDCRQAFATRPGGIPLRLSLDPVGPPPADIQKYSESDVFAVRYNSAGEYTLRLTAKPDPAQISPLGLRAISDIVSPESLATLRPASRTLKVTVT